MDIFEVTLGDASFAVELRSMSQNSSNTEVNQPHFHIDNELHIVLDGAATMRLDNKDIPTTAGDAYIIPPNVCHYYQDYTENFNKISCLFTLSKNHGTERSFSEYDYYNKIFGSLKECVFINDRSVLNIAEQLFTLEFSEETEHIYKTLYALLFISMAKLIEKQLPTLSKGFLSESDVSEYGKEPSGQKKIIELFLSERYNEGVTINDLAKKLYKSVPQTHRTVKKYFGDNFKKILTKQRMERAFIMLKQKELPLSEIALLNGYSTYGGFLSAFKKYTGMTPEEYRKTLTQNNSRRHLYDTKRI